MKNTKDFTIRFSLLQIYLLRSMFSQSWIVGQPRFDFDMRKKHQGTKEGPAQAHEGKPFLDENREEFLWCLRFQDTSQSQSSSSTMRRRTASMSQFVRQNSRCLAFVSFIHIWLHFAAAVCGFRRQRRSRELMGKQQQQNHPPSGWHYIQNYNYQQTSCF